MAANRKEEVTLEPGEVAKNRYAKPFTPMKPKPHPRQADIDAAQPPVRSIQARGTGYTRSPGGREGT